MKVLKFKTYECDTEIEEETTENENKRESIKLLKMKTKSSQLKELLCKTSLTQLKKRN